MPTLQRNCWNGGSSELKRFVCRTEEETMALGERLLLAVPVPGVIALYGDLGAGKTALVRGMGRALGIDSITSPTFTIVHEYRTKPQLCHFDAYRLDGADAIFEIGFDEYLAKPDAVLVLEWAELVEDALPHDRLNVRLTGSGDDPREICLEPVGNAYERAVTAL